MTQYLRNVWLIANPAAGKNALRAIKRAEEILKDKVILSTFITRKKGDAESFAREVSMELGVESSEYKNNQSSLITHYSSLLVVAGGDGTFNEVINGLLLTGKSAIPLGLLPLGTTNVLAKELEIPEDIESAVRLALNGTPKTISLGRINGRYFSLMAGIGFDGDAVFGVKDNIKKISGRGAYIFSGIRSLIKYDPPLIEVKTSSGIFTGYTAVIGKASCYGGYFKVTPTASLTEPVLDLCLFKGRARRNLFRFVSGVIRKRHLTFEDVFYGKFSELEITSEGIVHIQIDGDYFGTLPAKIDVVRDAVNLVW
ncbi:MAG: diacylglycerol kinase family lipid kinase [Nitrospirae bacterium]|nr:diacylglycerol kinase family lipid kinase [Nitrospirota bacterium]